MKPDSILGELWAVKDKFARDAGYDVDRFVQNLRHWEQTHPQSGRVIRNAEELRVWSQLREYFPTVYPPADSN